jgi:hypothetical protein
MHFHSPNGGVESEHVELASWRALRGIDYIITVN